MLKAHVLSKRAEGVVSGPLFPNGEGNYCAKQPVVDSIRKAVDLTGGNSLGMEGGPFSGIHLELLDPITIQLLGRWGSSAVLSYLAEAPLTSMADPMCSRALRHWVSAEAFPPSGDLDNRAVASRALAELKAANQRMDH